jgi:hypothetical protein
MMKNFMTSGTLSRSRKPKRDLGRKDVAPVYGEAAVMTIFG